MPSLRKRLQARGQLPHEEVRGFHAAHYSANVMRGAVVSQQPMAQLEALVRAKFGAVPNTDLRAPVFAGAFLAYPAWTAQAVNALVPVPGWRPAHSLLCVSNVKNIPGAELSHLAPQRVCLPFAPVMQSHPLFPWREMVPFLPCF